MIKFLLILFTAVLILISVSGCSGFMIGGGNIGGGTSTFESNGGTTSFDGFGGGVSCGGFGTF